MREYSISSFVHAVYLIYRCSCILTDSPPPSMSLSFVAMLPLREPVHITHKTEEIVHTRNSYGSALVCFMLNSFTFIPIEKEWKKDTKKYVTHQGRGFRFSEKVFSVLDSCVSCVRVCGFSLIFRHILGYRSLKELVAERNRPSHKCRTNAYFDSKTYVNVWKLFTKKRHIDAYGYGLNFSAAEAAVAGAWFCHCLNAVCITSCPKTLAAKKTHNHRLHKPCISMVAYSCIHHHQHINVASRSRRTIWMNEGGVDKYHGIEKCRRVKHPNMMRMTRRATIELDRRSSGSQLSRQCRR